MVKTFSAAQMDQLQCSNPGCNHKDHNTRMFMHGRCHVHAPSFIFYKRPVMGVICSECGELIVNVAVLLDDAPEEFMQDELTLECPECESKQLWASYELNSGKISIECYRCKKESQQVPIR